MKARIIHTKIWTDYWFKKLNRSSKIVFLYLLSNQFIGLSGIYEITNEQICFDVGITSTELEEAKKHLSKKISFHENWVKIFNYEKYQTYKGSKNEVAKEKERNLVPSVIRDTLSIPYRYPIDSTSNQKSVISNKKLVISNKKPEDEDFKEIAEKYGVPKSFVLSKWDDLENYCASTGKKYKNYKATLMNWVKRDALKIKREDKNANRYGKARGGIIIDWR